MKVWCPWDAIHCANSLGSCGMLGRMSISLRGVVLATPTKAVRRSRYACIESETASAAFAPFSFGRVLGRFLSFPVLVNFSMVFGNCVLQSDFGQGVVGRESVVRVLWFTRRSTKTAMAHGASGLSSVAPRLSSVFCCGRCCGTRVWPFPRRTSKCCKERRLGGRWLGSSGSNT